MNLLVTGGAGFIGSNFIKYFIDKYKDYKIICLDKLTYAGSFSNIKELSENKRFTFIQGDIGDLECLSKINADSIINFAADTHVDRSLQNNAFEFLDTNVRGVYVLAQYALEKKVKKFLHISTDEVYGSKSQGYAKEDDRLCPSNLYSASKASAEHIVMSFFKTFSLPVFITRSTNNFGPFQYPEKVIPLFVTNALENKRLPLYADGANKRHWLDVYDNCNAIDIVFHKGSCGEIYNIGSDNEMSNLQLAKEILRILGKTESLIEFVKDRPGHDFRYAVDSSKVRALGWVPGYDFISQLRKTVQWYVDNKDWWSSIKNPKSDNFYNKQYGN